MQGTREPQDCSEKTKEETRQKLRSSRAAQPTENDLAEEFAEQVVYHFAFPA